MLAQKGKAIAGETMAKPLQNASLLADKCYQVHSALSRKNLFIFEFVHGSVLRGLRYLSKKSSTILLTCGLLNPPWPPPLTV